MAFINFYNGRTRALEREFSNEVINFSYTIGFNGSASGYVEIEETPDNISFLRSLRENSHFVKYGVDIVHGGVVESVTNKRNIWTVNFIGANEYLDKVDAVASHKASVADGVASKNDHSWVKVFYAESVTGIIHGILKDQKDAMSLRGYDNRLFDISQLEIVEYPTSWGSTWFRSYRLNTLETPTVKSVLDDILSDKDTQLFTISVSNNLKEPFRFIFSIVNSSSSYTIDESKDNIFNISRDDRSLKRRSFSIAKGTDLKENSVLSRVDFDSNVAYSSLITSSQQEKSNSIRNSAVSEIEAIINNHGHLNFSSHYDAYNILDYLTISSKAMPKVSGIVVEKSIEGNIVNYSMQIGEPSRFNAEISKAPNDTRILFSQSLDRADSLSKRANQRKGSNNTGWRS